MLILLTNDDGIRHPGLVAMYRELTRLGEVHVVAPETVQSATGHGVTLTPLRGERRSGPPRPMAGRPVALAHWVPFANRSVGPLVACGLAITNVDSNRLTVDCTAGTSPS